MTFRKTVQYSPLPGFIASTYPIPTILSDSAALRQLCSSNASAEHKPVNRFVPQQVTLDQFPDIVNVVIGIPNPFRINNENRPFFASTETSRLINTNPAGTMFATFLEIVFCKLACLARIMLSTTRRSIPPLVGAKEYMSVIKAHR